VPNSSFSFPTKKLLAWFAKVARPLPWREEYIPYHVLLSEMMLQQTQVVTALPYYDRWLKKWPTWESLAHAQESEVLKMWEGLGYYQRARRLLELAQIVSSEYQGTLPRDEAQLAKLPGFGPYTVAAVSAIAFNQAAFPIDGNVRRVLARFMGNTLTSPSTEQDDIFKNIMLPEFVRVKQRRHLAQAMMELGALVCAPKKPLCSECPLQADCSSASPEKALLLPIKKTKAKAKIMHIAYVWLKTPAGFPLRQRPSKGRFPSQWEPLVAEANSEEDAKGEVQEYFNNNKSSRDAGKKIIWKPCFRRDFTTYHVTWHEGVAEGDCSLEGYEYFSKAQIKKLNLVPVMAKTWACL
jgi:A/G-specific adenine glycosylase